jgi:hypothetical protein
MVPAGERKNFAFSLARLHLLSLLSLSGPVRHTLHHPTPPLSVTSQTPKQEYMGEKAGSLFIS